jgi:hypothetical protein
MHLHATDRRREHFFGYDFVHICGLVVVFVRMTMVVTMIVAMRVSAVTLSTYRIAELLDGNLESFLICLCRIILK